MFPKVSIIVPVYNVEQYLQRCMNSLLNQSLKDIEIILVDDGSPDNCPSMCDEYVIKDARVKVIHKKNEGLGYARNSGIEIAKGEYIAFVDSDDYVELTMYEILYSNAKGQDAVFCGFREELFNGTYIHKSECREKKNYHGESIKKVLLDFIASPPYDSSEYKYEMSVWHSIYSSKIVKENKIRFVSEREFASEDIPFQVDFLWQAKSIMFIPEVLYTYCLNTSSLTKTFVKEKFDKFKNLYYLLCNKTCLCDKDGLRSKRLFIGYTRAFMIFMLYQSLSVKERKRILYDIVNDDIWVEIKAKYPIKYLPLHQRGILHLIYHKNIFFLYPYLWIYKRLSEKR